MKERDTLVWSVIKEERMFVYTEGCVLLMDGGMDGWKGRIYDRIITTILGKSDVKQ